MRMAIKDNEVELDFQIISKQILRNPTVDICDLSYTDDIVIIPEEIEQAK